MSIYDTKPWLNLYDDGQSAEISLEFTDALSSSSTNCPRRFPASCCAANSAPAASGPARPTR